MRFTIKIPNTEDVFYVYYSETILFFAHHLWWIPDSRQVHQLQLLLLFFAWVKLNYYSKDNE